MATDGRSIIWSLERIVQPTAFVDTKERGYG
jgi:hypothetical protein